MPLTKFFFKDNIFYVNRNVYSPAEDSLFFAEKLSVKENDFVLDMGVGCGILSILAAKKGAKVVAIDLNPYAIKCAYKNAYINCVNDKILFLQGDLFSPLNITTKFDVVLFNAPYLPVKITEDMSWVEYAWAGGDKGRQIIDRFINKVPLYLKKSGTVYLLQSNLSDVQVSLRKFHKKKIEANINATLKLPFFESLYLIMATKNL
jgi:release factor glutamine methyltransferase